MKAQSPPTHAGLPSENLADNSDSPWALAGHVPLLITVSAGLIVYGLFYNRGIWLSVVGYSVSPAERVLNGEVPYRDFLFNYTPGILWLNATLMRVFGTALMPIQAGLLAFKLSALVMLYWLGKRVMSPWAALIPVGLVLCWLGHRYIFNVHPTQYSMLFVLAAIILTLRFDDTGDVRWLIASGVLIGLVFVFKYNVGLILLGAGSAAIIALDAVPGWARARSRSGAAATLGGVSMYWLGFSAVAVAMCGYLAARGALGPMVDHFMHHAADYSEERSVGLPSWRLLLPAGTGFLTAAIGLQIVQAHAPRLLLAATYVFAAIGGALVLMPGRAGILKDAAPAAVAYFPAFTFLVTLCWILFRVRDNKRKGDQTGTLDRERRLMVVAWFALGAYLEVYPRADYYHLVRVLPPVFLVFIILFSCIFCWAPATTSDARSARQAMVGLAPLLVLMLAFTGLKDSWLPQFDGWFRLADRTPVAIPRAHGIRVSEYQAGVIGDLTELIESNSSPRDSIFSFARRGAAFYFFAGRRNPTRLLWWDSVGIKPGDRAAVFDMLKAGGPKLILIQMALDDPQIREIVNANYQKIGGVEDIEVLLRNASSGGDAGRCPGSGSGVVSFMAVPSGNQNINLLTAAGYPGRPVDPGPICFEKGIETGFSKSAGLLFAAGVRKQQTR